MSGDPEPLLIDADLTRTEPDADADVQRGPQIGGEQPVRRERAALGAGRGDHDAPRGEMPEKAEVALRWLQPAVSERDRGQTEPAARRAHDAGQADEGQITVQHVVWSASGQLFERVLRGRSLLGSSRHGQQR